MLTGKQRAYLKQLSHDIDPVINIGKNSISDELLKAIDDVLEKRELIKIKVLNNNTDDIEIIIDEIINGTKCEFVQKIGSIITVYRRSKRVIIDLV